MIFLFIFLFTAAHLHLKENNQYDQYNSMINVTANQIKRLVHVILLDNWKLYALFALASSNYALYRIHFFVIQDLPCTRIVQLHLIICR
jgi:hypothetical protein